MQRVLAKVYTELPLKRAICLYMGTIGEAPEMSRGPISISGVKPLIWTSTHTSILTSGAM